MVRHEFIAYCSRALRFYWDRRRWKQEYLRRLESYSKSLKGLAARSRLCCKLVQKHAQPDDIVFSFGLLFLPKMVDWPNPSVSFKDYTVELQRRSPWTPPLPDECLQARAALEAEFCRGVSMVLTASENTRRAIIADYGVNAESVTTVGEGLCFPDPPPMHTRRPGHARVLFIGKDFERKGGDVLLAAFEKVRAANPSSSLAIVGPSRSPTGQAGVEWAGLVQDRGVIKDYYESADVFVLPSRCEPFGLVFLEAMAFGLPCIGTNQDAMPEIIRDGETGYLVEANNATALAEKITHLLRNPVQSAEMGRRGRERVLRQFLWAHVAERIDRRLQTLLEPTAR